MASFSFEFLRRFWHRNPEILIGFCLGITCGIYHCTDKLTSSADICTGLSDKESGLPQLSHSENDDYDPVILHPEKKTPPEVQPAPIPARPRYYSSELGIHEPLYVAVSSSPSTLPSWATALNQTAATYLPRLSFFVSNISEGELRNYQNTSMHIVHTSDSGARVRALSIIRFLIDNQQVNSYDWFFIVPDSTYIRAKKLVEYVRRLSAGHANYVGVAVKKDSFTFCSFEAGVLLSQDIMRKISGILVSCSEAGNVDPTSDIGNCVLKAVGLHCNEGFFGQEFSSYRVSEHQPLADQDKTAQLIESTEFIRAAVTIYPLTVPEHISRLHLELNKNEISELNSVIEDLQDDIVKQSASTPSRGRELQWPIGANPSSVAKNRFDLVEWTYFNSTHLIRPDDFHVTERLAGASARDTEQIIEYAARKTEEVYSSKNMKFVEFRHGYRRFDPARGIEYLLDLTFQTENEETGRDRRLINKRIRLLKTLGKMETIAMPFVTETTRVHIVLPIHSTEINASLAFLERFTRDLLEEQDNVFLMMVFIYGPNDPGKGDPNDLFLAVKQAAKVIEKRFSKTLGTRLGWVSIRNPLEIPPSEFAVLDLVAKKFTKDSIILRMTVRALLNGEFFNRVRLSTIAGSQVYFPIPFAQYNGNFTPKSLQASPETFDIKRQLGHFDRYATEVAAFYVMDYTTVRKSVQDVWPLVTVDKDLLKEHPRPNRNGQVFSLLTLFVNSDLHVFRGSEPMLVVLFFLHDCQGAKLVDEREYFVCTRRLQESLAGKQQLALFLADNQLTNDTSFRFN